MKQSEAMLRDAGLRVTRQRVAVLEYVGSHPHCLVDEVVGHVRASLGRVSVQATYDALAGLTAAGLVRRIQPAGSPTRYETRIGDNHHHIICRNCGQIEDVDCAVGEAPCLTPSQHHGFEVYEAEVVYWGHCADCQNPSADTEHS